MEIFYTFPSTHAVIFAEKVLLSAGLAVKVRPVPSAISAGCGLCLCVSLEIRQQTEAEMEKHSVAFSAVYELQEGQFNLLEHK